MLAHYIEAICYKKTSKLSGPPFSNLYGDPYAAVEFDILQRSRAITPPKFSTKCMKFKDLFCIFIVENDKFYVKNYNFKSL